MTSCTTRIKMATEAFPCSSSGDARQHPINIAVSNTILIGISAAIGFATVAGSDVALLLLLYLDRPIPISHLLAWELMFMGTWILATWIIYRLLVFVKFAPFRGAKHNERHQC
ncbi:hypothetical protein ColKHC_00430 [Colletotrichum higginsianum]|nr:hypothetical protein ColKHC_00430 [Colletotrichum higginsianum]